MKKIALIFLLLILTTGLLGCPWWHHHGGHGGGHDGGHGGGHYQRGR